MDYERHNALSNIMGLSLPKNFGVRIDEVRKNP